MTGQFLTLSVVGILVRVGAALVANLLLAVGAYKKRSVTLSGGIMGFFLGFVIFLSGGFGSWFVLGTFFVTSSFLGRITNQKKEKIAQIHEKGTRRDALQAFSNAGPGAVFMVLYLFVPRPEFLVAYLGSMACANADTWSSEIGVLSTSQPVSLLSFRKVIPGTSGAVSLLGLWASALGAMVIAIAALPLFFFHPDIPVIMPFILFFAGIFGGFFDSLLGAFVQSQYKNSAGEVTEKPFEGSKKNVLLRGWSWMNNDGVNLVSNSFATLLSLGSIVLIRGL